MTNRPAQPDLAALAEEAFDAAREGRYSESEPRFVLEEIMMDAEDLNAAMYEATSDITGQAEAIEGAAQALEQEATRADALIQALRRKESN